MVKKSLDEILMNPDLDDTNKSRHIALLPESVVDVVILEKFIKDVFNRYPDVLSAKFNNKGFSTNMRRLIRIYDFLKYKS